MATLILKYEAKVLKRVLLRQAVFTIGRTPGSDLVIDNLAVSAPHARICFETDRFVLEDLNSLNGTFVNRQRIHKSDLKDGDEIQIGKHTLLFQDEGLLPEFLESAAGRAAPVAKLESTVVLDTRKQREFLQKATTVAEGGVSPSAVAKVGCLIVLAGKTDQKEYILTARMAVIGKSPMASVKLQGWFAPDVAAVIMNKGKTSYQIAPAAKGKVRLNGRAISSPQDLKEGDQIEVAGVKAQFNYRE